ncbi:MAG: carboxypeptidase regulatory-like domain-containing protein [Bryobacteraceae bacterium]
MLRLLHLACSIVILVSVLPAQFGSGIQGTVADRTAAVVPGARVVAVNVDTGVSREAVSSDIGAYRISSLSSGTYKITATKEGFGSAEQGSVVLGANEVRKVDFVLTVGNVVETVTVTAQPTILETEEGRISGQLDSKQLRELPVPNRNVFNLLSLQPGVSGRTLTSNNVGGSSTPQINANGQRVDSNSFTVDDMNANSISRGGRSEVTPNLETVAEVRVVANNFSAVQGRNMGAQVSVVTKSGTNQLHGAVWEYHRNNKLQSRNLFQSSVPISRMNQYGFGVGGPIIRNRTFFYVTYEGLKDTGANTATATVETRQLRDYVLQTRPNSIAAQIFGKYRPIGDPTINLRDLGRPMPGVNTFSSAADGILDVGTVQYQSPTANKSNQVTWRIDHELRPGKDRLYAYYYRHTGGGGCLTPCVRPDFRRYNPTKGNFGNVNYTHVFSPTTLNEFRAGVTRWEGTYSDPFHKDVPELVITGLGTIRDVNTFPGGWFPTEYVLRDQVSSVRGTHGLKFGGEIRRAHNNLWHTRYYLPAYTFASVLDFIDDEPIEMRRTVDPRTGEPISTRVDQRIWEGDLFVQDDWKVRRNLTINIGLRYDYFGPYTDSHNRLRDFIPGPGSSSAGIAAGKVDVVPKSWNTDTLNFAPRFGFAWDLGGKGKNVVRGGYGISYDRMATVYTAGYRENPPLAATATLGLLFGTSFTYALGDESKPNFGHPVDASLKVGLDERNGIKGVRVALRAIDDNFNNPYAHNWFLGYQRALPGRLVLETSYIGSAGHHLVNITDVNRYNGDLLDGRFDGFNPSFSQINLAQTNSQSAYHGATVSVRKQFSRGFSLSGNYTYGKVLTDAEAEQDVTNFYDAANRKLDRSVASFDVPQRMALVGVWELPLLRACSSMICKMAGGWQLSGYAVMEQGRPTNVTTDAAYPNGDFNADNVRADRPNAPAESVKRNGFSKQEFLNGVFRVTDFPRPPSGQLGNLGRNAFRAPGFARVDASLMKTFPVFAERVSANLRLESFNALNRANLNAPTANLNNNNFGKTTGADPGRVYQVSLMLRF